MNTPINDGGPAFPVDSARKFQTGMTLRDWFAGQAMDSAWELEKKFPCGEYNSPSYRGAAARAFLFADAMIAERNTTS